MTAATKRCPRCRKTFERYGCTEARPQGRPYCRACKQRRKKMQSSRERLRRLPRVMRYQVRAEDGSFVFPKGLWVEVKASSPRGLTLYAVIDDVPRFLEEVPPGAVCTPEPVEVGP